jgi:GTP-binding protein
MQRVPVVVKQAIFEALAVDQKSWPPEDAPEIAFAGRSNVGKSSLINALAGRRGLARTSSTPGRTRGLVFFRIETQDAPPLRFVDLPGYGYAQASKKERAAWRPMVESYVERRGALRLLVVLIDARRGLQPSDEELLEWLDSIDRPYVVVFTKLDQVPRTKRNLPRGVIGFSLLENLGTDDLWRAILRATLDR